VGKNVAVFVDVANIFYAAKAAGVDIDYVTLLRSATAGRDLVRAYAYTGLDPDNENQRNFHAFLARNNYKVVSKDIRKYGDGKVKANLDIELVVDMMKTARNLDIAIVVSGDGDFAPAIRAVQEMGVRCEVISFRGNTSSDLIEVADLFTDITQLAKVEKGSRSGRRVAEDDQDLSMTEVPDKQTEGTGRGRGRGRGRDRGGDREPVAASASAARGRGRRRPVGEASENGTAGVVAQPGVVALPGERLSKAVIGSLTEADLARAEVFTLEDDGAAAGAAGVSAEPSGDGSRDDEQIGEDGQRRRRRRGGRGRGRGRGRTDAEGAEPAEAAASGEGPEDAERVVEDAQPAPARRPVVRVEDETLPEEPRRPRSTPFGSVWDSQLGTSTPAPSTLAPLPEEEFDDEPEIPEYLIAERNRGARGGRGGRAGGARGGRAAYQSAIARERFGRGGGSGGINRYPDVSERTSRGPAPAARREERPARPDRAPAGAAPGRGGGEWSEVPPELEELLRAQLSQRPASRPADAPEEPGGRESSASAEPDAAPEAATTGRRRTTRRTQPAAGAASDDTAAPAEADAAPATRRRTTKRTPAADAQATGTPASDESAEEAPAPKPRRRTTRSTAAAAADESATAAPPAPKTRRRTTRSSSAATEEAAVPGDAPASDESAEEAPAPKPRRRTTRKTASTEPA